MKQLILDLFSEAPARFEHFVVGDNGALLAALHEAALAGSEPLYLWGAARTGKSHLLQATVTLAQEASRPARLVAAETARPEDFEVSGLLAVDGIDALPADAQIALFNAFNRRTDQALTLLLGGAAAPRALALREDLRTRIGQSLVFEIRPLGDPDRRKIIAALADRRGIRLDDEVLDFVLRHGRRDLPTLLEVLQALDDASLEHQRRITLPLLRSLVQAGLTL